MRDQDQPSSDGVPELIKRMPLTLIMLTLIIGLGLFANSHVSELDERFHQSVGSSGRLLLEGELHRMFASLLFTAGGIRFYQSVLMLALALGWTEWHFGTGLSAMLFFGIHVATVIIVSLVIALPLVNYGLEHGRVLFSERDVGPSAGYYGCLGYSLAWLKQPKVRLALISGIAALLSVRLTWSIVELKQLAGGALSADLAHAIALPLGLLAARFGSPRKRVENRDIEQDRREQARRDQEINTAI